MAQNVWSIAHDVLNDVEDTAVLFPELLRFLDRRQKDIVDETTSFQRDVAERLKGVAKFSTMNEAERAILRTYAFVDD